MMLTIKTDITIGDVLTTVSILLSVIALVYAWSKDQSIKRRDQANRIRSSAVKTLAKFYRWQEIFGWYFDSLQPIFVEISQNLSQEFDVLSARDSLWKQLNILRIEIKKQILDEDIESAYVELYGFIPEIYTPIVETMGLLRDAEEKVFINLIEQTQEDVMTFYKTDKDAYSSAQLGNALRDSASIYREDLRERFEIIIKDLRDCLVIIVTATDGQLLQQGNLK